MIDTWVVVLASAGYLGLLFAIATYGDRRARRGRSIISSGVVYSLSLAVYATSWTYYGSVGRAASGGVAFLPTYLGPTVAMAAWWVVVRKIIRICKRDRITSLSDFLAARYGNSAGLGALVTVVAVVGIVPYIALQLKAISSTFTVLRGGDVASPVAAALEVPLLQDTALYTALLLAAFTIVFGTRHLDASERHEGMVAAIAFESVVKLAAFLVVGCYVVFGLFGGFGDLFRQAAASPDLARLLTFDQIGSHGSWLWLTVLALLAVLLLPRQWQVAVVENVDERHLRTASWLFPLYLLLANVFVLPIALAGLLTFGRDGADPDTFVLALPLADGQPGLALLVFLGGLSAATGMVIVETIALSTMVSNSLVIPLLLRRGGRLARRPSLAGVVLGIRRVTIVAVLLLGFVYFRVAGETRALVAIGLVSFAAVAQFAPALLGGLFWRGVTRRGAVAGLAGGFVVWAYTLLLPYVAQSSGLPAGFVQEGPFGIGLLAPQALLGLDGMDEISHAMTWSMLVNVGLLVGLSLTGRRDAAEHLQAAAFVDVLDAARDSSPLRHRGTASADELHGLLERFLGPDRAREALAAYAERTGAVALGGEADGELVRHVETLLAGAVGSTSARFVVASVVSEEPLGVPQVMEILDETSQVLATSRALERKSRELEAATAELREANGRLQELDRLKDDFVSTVTHELRTPLTSIRAFSEILLDNPELDAAEREEFLRTVVDETARLTRLINQVLDLSKLESGAAEWQIEPVDLAEVVHSCAASVGQLLRDKDVELQLDLPEQPPVVRADRDRVVQVLVNLLSNAVKFTEPGAGRIRVHLQRSDGKVETAVTDNGPGIPPAEQQAVFEKFRQGGGGERPAGTGLGLPISREIVQRLGGRLTVRSVPGEGATFAFTLPLAEGTTLAQVATVGDARDVQRER
ncbi:MAG TPA: sensor histidine kinase [Mycobacteriales bacterium]|nr:sensor histidine kinase [Mycobacteriales bacterium]